MKLFEKFKNHIQKAETILITTHIYPDGDGIGSEIALCHALKSLNKQVFCVHEETLGVRYHFLDKEKNIQSFNEFSQKKHPEFDLILIVDTNSQERVGENVKALIKKGKKHLFIDHHPCSADIYENHCIDLTAAATGEIVGHFILRLGIPFSKPMGLAIYTSIIIDTSSFRYPTVSGSTHRLIGQILDSGINPQEAYSLIYGTREIEHIQFLGKILEKAKCTKKNRVAWLIIPEKLRDEFHVSLDETHAFINHLLVLNEVSVAVMFVELNANEYKVSLRSHREVDVATIAFQLGGGGHNHSAACILQGTLDSIIQLTLDKIEERLP